MKNNENIPKGKEVTTVQSVDRALNLLKIIANSSREMSVLELSEITGLNRTTVWRLVSSLEENGFIEKDYQTKGFQLSYGIAEIIPQNKIFDILIRHARPHLEQLKKLSGETAILSVPTYSGVLAINQVNTDYSIRLVDYTNSVAPLHCTSNGKLLLAYMDALNLKNYMQHSLEKFTELTITDEKVLRKELDEVKRSQFGYCRGEYNESENAISSVLIGEDQKIICFLTVGGPTFRFDDEKMEAMRPHLKKCILQLKNDLTLQKYM